MKYIVEVNAVERVWANRYFEVEAADAPAAREALQSAYDKNEALTAAGSAVVDSETESWEVGEATLAEIGNDCEHDWRERASSDGEAGTFYLICDKCGQTESTV